MEGSADNICEPSAFPIEEAADKESNGSSDSEAYSKDGTQESGGGVGANLDGDYITIFECVDLPAPHLP